MKIRNEKAFGEEEIKVIRMYFEWIIKAKEDEYEKTIEKRNEIAGAFNLVILRINMLDRILKFMNKHEKNKVIMFIFNDLGLSKEFFEEWLDNSFDQRDILDEKYDQLSVFIDDYENLVNNGLVIKKSNSFKYDVIPYDGEPYVNFEDAAINNSKVYEITRK